jgi:hypothetical protein
MVVLLMELLSSRIGSGDPMAADKGFEAWSLLTPEEDERRSAGEGVAFLAGAAKTTGAACAASTTGAALVLAATGLTAGILSAAAGLLLPGAATAF